MERGRSFQLVILGLIVFFLGYSYCASRSSRRTQNPSQTVQNALPGGKTTVTSSPPPTLPTRLDTALIDQGRLEDKNKELKEKVLQTLDEQAIFLLCRVVSIGNLYGRFGSAQEADAFKNTVKSVLVSGQSYFTVFDDITDCSSPLSLSSEEKCQRTDYYLAVPTKQKHRRLFGYQVSSLPSVSYTLVRYGENKVMLAVNTVAEAMVDVCNDNRSVLSSSAADKNTAGELWSDDIVRALRKISVYQGTLSTFEVNDTKLEVVWTRLEAMKNGKIDLDDDSMERCESELNKVDEGLKKVSEQMAAKISKPETEEIEKIWSLCRSGSTVKKSK